MSETVEKYMEAVRQNGYALGDVPEEQRTAEVCLAAVRQNGGALCYVPEERRTEIARQYGLGKEPPKGAA
jgi:hypothetical protein